MNCLEKLVECIAKFKKGEIDADTSCQIENQILTDEIDDPEFLEFAVENISELFGYIATGRVNIRICRDITGEMWFGVGQGQIGNQDFLLFINYLLISLYSLFARLESRFFNILYCSKAESLSFKEI